MLYKTNTYSYLEGNFPTEKKCKFHCSPTCHPGQVDVEKWHYGCLHKAWPENKIGDFCPLVDCDGDFKHCEMIGKQFLGRYKGGKTLSLRYAEAKVKRLKEDLKFIEELTKKI